VPNANDVPSGAPHPDKLDQDPGSSRIGRRRQ
jgi:hypothetical protein